MPSVPSTDDLSGNPSGDPAGDLRRVIGGRGLVLASGSAARAAVLSEAGTSFVVDRPNVHERQWDHLLTDRGPSALAVHLAGLKAADVAPRHHGPLVLAADQVGVLEGADGPQLLQQRATVDGAVAQLVAMAGTTHELVNGLILVDTVTGERVEGVDVQTVTMADYGEAAARRYVEQFRPFESAGSYRIEDQTAMAPGDRLLVAVEGEHVSGVRGLPLPLLVRLVVALLGGSGNA